MACYCQGTNYQSVNRLFVARINYLQSLHITNNPTQCIDPNFCVTNHKAFKDECVIRWIHNIDKNVSAKTLAFFIGGK